MYKFSVIVPCYNIENRVDKLFELFREKTDVAIEAIFVDDCSTDNSFELMRQKQLEYRNVFVYQTDKNGGPGMARNVGLMHARGKYIVFCDSDDEFEIPYMSQVCNYIDELNEPDMLVFPHMVIRGEKEVKEDCFKQYKHLCEVKAEDIACGFGGPVAKVFKKEIIDRNKIFFPNRMTGEDCCFVVNYAVHVKKAYKIDYSYYRYVMNKQSVTHSYYKKELEQPTTYELLQRVFKEHFPDKEIEMFVNRHLLTRAKQMSDASVPLYIMRKWYKSENLKYPNWINEIAFDEQSIYRKCIYLAMYYNRPMLIKMIMQIRKLLY